MKIKNNIVRSQLRVKWLSVRIDSIGGIHWFGIVLRAHSRSCDLCGSSPGKLHRRVVWPSEYISRTNKLSPDLVGWISNIFSVMWSSWVARIRNVLGYWICVSVLWFWWMVSKYNFVGFRTNQDLTTTKRGAFILKAGQSEADQLKRPIEVGECFSVSCSLLVFSWMNILR